jgi:hypothetical protein
MNAVEREKRQARAILARAADLIESEGWTQGESVDRMGRMCALGAIGASRNTLDFNSPVDLFWATRRAKQMLRRALTVSIAEWNDTLGRTKEEVVAKLREVAQGG